MTISCIANVFFIERGNLSLSKRYPMVSRLMAYMCIISWESLYKANSVFISSYICYP